ncbi:uracil-xanthine permease family protein [Spiroplasma sp. BIUS-1]|uniref:uracil-xanthine permease family protein n=1 Tax=Spiroplasma sp. BIUS-1 TaxID=216964 RepID=UPI001397C08A|nr:uracil-xanthine permease family protein [Spiroplasma sp. BIUS-1]QHX36373.1 uracil permease [Spiroplasma sp. BIUS-1]
MEENKKIDLILQPNQRPKNFGQWTILSIQHVFAMFGATVLVPMVINQTANDEVINISMALFCSGFGTLIYIALTMAKVPIYLGSSFAYMTVLGTGWKDWGNSIFIAVFAVGLVYILMGFIIHWTGVKWIKKAFSPIVVGPIIITIGLSAVPSALQNIGFAAAQNPQDNAWGNYPQWLAIIIGVITFLVAAICMLKAKSFLKVIPILMALTVGYVISLILHFSLTKTGYQIIHTEYITNTNQWEWHPSFKKVWNVDPKTIGPALVAIVPISMVTMVEHLGDHINIGNMTGRDFIKNPGISRTLIADGVAMSLAGLIGGPANATYAENTSVVGLTKVASVWVTGLAAIFAIAMSFIAPINQIIRMIPSPVMGGISLMLFGMIASNGIKIMIDSKIDLTNAKNLIVISVILGVGVGMSIMKSDIIMGSFHITGLFLATFLGVSLNLLLPNHDNLGIATIFRGNKKKKK